MGTPSPPENSRALSKALGEGQSDVFKLMVTSKELFLEPDWFGRPGTSSNVVEGFGCRDTQRNASNLMDPLNIQIT